MEFLEQINKIYCISTSNENWHLFQLLSLPSLKFEKPISKITQPLLFANELSTALYQSYRDILKDATSNNYDKIFILMDTVILNKKYFAAINHFLFNSYNDKIVSLTSIKSQKSILNWKAIIINLCYIDDLESLFIKCNPKSPEKNLVDCINDIQYTSIKNHLLDKYQLKMFVIISGLKQFENATNFQSIENAINKQKKSEVCKSIAARYRIYNNYPRDFKHLNNLLENPIYLQAKYELLRHWKLSEVTNTKIIQHLLNILKINVNTQNSFRNYINLLNPNIHEILKDFFSNNLIVDATSRLCVFVSPFGLYLGGGEYYFLKLVEQCLLCGREVMIVNPTPLEDVYRTMEKFNISIFCDSSRFYYFQSSIRIVDYFHNQFALYFEMGNKSYPTVKSKGKFSIFHSQFPFNHQEKISENIKERLKSYDIILANSYFTANSLGKIYHTVKPLNCPFIGVLHPPTVPLGIYKNNKKAQICLIGRFTSIKNHLVAIEVFSNILQTFPEWKLHIIGSTIGNKNEYYNQCISLANHTKNNNQIIIHRNITNDYKFEILKSSAIYLHLMGLSINSKINPENTEHFGISLIEAIHYRCIPIVANNGNLSFVIQDDRNGFLVNNQAHLQNCLQYCIRNYKEIYSKFEEALGWTSFLYNQEIYEIMATKLISTKYNKKEYIFWNHIFVHLKKCILNGMSKDLHTDYCIFLRNDNMEGIIAGIIALFYTRFPIIIMDSQPYLLKISKIISEPCFVFDSFSNYRKILYLDSDSFLIGNFDYFMQFDHISGNGVEWVLNFKSSKNSQNSQQTLPSYNTIRLFESITASTKENLDIKSLNNKFIKLYCDLKQKKI